MWAFAAAFTPAELPLPSHGKRCGHRLPELPSLQCDHTGDGHFRHRHDAGEFVFEWHHTAWAKRTGRRVGRG